MEERGRGLTIVVRMVEVVSVVVGLIQVKGWLRVVLKLIGMVWTSQGKIN